MAQGSKWRRRIHRLSLGARNALEIARFGRLTEPYQAPFRIEHQDEFMRLRHYEGRRPGTGLDAPILLVPPLMVTSDVYDIAPDISAIAKMLDEGADVWLCDFGAPEREEGGMERTLDAHVQTVSRAVDFVADATGQDVHLAGYSQGGMFCYQAAAFRRSHRLASVITFGSPVDIHRNLPNVADGAAEQIIHVLRTLIERPLGSIDGLPGFMSSTAFKMVSLRKELSQVADFVAKLHDRAALEKRESRRRFLGGEGFVAWPGPALRKFVDEFIVHNRMLSGGFVIDGRTVTLADITCPVLYFVGERDDIAQPSSVQAIQRAVVDADLYEVLVPAGHFGLVVGSRALERTWPTVLQWLRWHSAGGTKPRALVAEPETVPLEDPEVAGFDDIDVDLKLFFDAVGDTLGALWRRLGELTDDAGDVMTSLRYQVPLLEELERMTPQTRISVGKTLAEQAAKSPDQTFFLWRSRAFTYQEADQRVDAVVRGLFSLGVESGDRVAVLMNGRPSLLTMVTALNRMGAVALVLRPSDADAAIRGALEPEAPRHLITDPELAPRARALVPKPVTVAVLGGGGEARDLGVTGVIDMERIDPAKVTLPARHTPNPGRARDVAMVLYSGARDGTLRSLEITNGRWAFSALGASAACTLTPSDTVYSALPLHHVAGMLVTVGSALVGGARLALADAIDGGGFPPGLQDDPEPFWREVRRYGASVVFYAGEMCRSLVDAPFQPTDKTNPVRLFAGSGMKPAVWRKLVDRFDAGVLEFYASSEGNAVLANASGEKVGALGRALPGSVEMALCAYDFEGHTFVRDERGLLRRCAAGEPGVLLSRIDATHPAYDRGGDPRVVRNVFAGGDRWWRSNDVLRQDADGDMWFLGRLHEVHLRDGTPTFTRPIEEALDRVPGVTLAIAFPDPDDDARFLAVLVPRAGAEVDADEVRAAVDKLAPTQRPSRVLVVPAADVGMTAGFRPMVRELAEAIARGDYPTVG